MIHLNYGIATYALKLACLIEQVQNPHPILYEVQHILVVHEFDVAPLNFLLFIFCLWQNYSILSAHDDDDLHLMIIDDHQSAQFG